MSIKKQIAQEKSAREIREKSQIARLQSELENAKREAQAYKTAKDELESMLADFHASKFDLPRQKIRQYQGKGSFCRVAFGDTHGCSIDPAAWSAVLADLEYLKPKQVIHGGDILDCDGWLASHHTTHYVAQTSYTYADEVIAGNQMLDQLQARCPKAEIDLIEGNHDLRVETWAITTTQKTKADADLLIRSVAPRYVLNVDKRGINWYSRGECHDDSVAGGTIRRGLCYFTHPQSSSKHHAAKMAENFGTNVVYFHTHRRDYFPAGNVKGDEWAAWCPGCLCVKRKYWHHTENFKHTQGYHLQLVKADGSFLGINVPIIAGKSYLTGLLKL